MTNTGYNKVTYYLPQEGKLLFVTIFTALPGEAVPLPVDIEKCAQGSYPKKTILAHLSAPALSVFFGKDKRGCRQNISYNKSKCIVEGRKGMPRIYGEDIMLREYQKEDLPHIREWVNDPEIVDSLSDYFVHPHTLNKTEKFLNAILEKNNNEEHFVIADNTGEYLGQIGLRGIDFRNRISVLGIVIGKKNLIGKGIGSKAIQLVQRYAFESLNLNKLELSVHSYNTRAYRCYLKCGFIEEGRLREKFYIKGKYKDVILMEILRKEYEKIIGKS